MVLVPTRNPGDPSPAPTSDFTSYPHNTLWYCPILRSADRGIAKFLREHRAFNNHGATIIRNSEQLRKSQEGVMSLLNHRHSGMDQSAQILLPRPLLVFKHNAKAGGESIMKLLNQLKSFTYHVDHLKESIACKRATRELPKRYHRKSTIRRGFDDEDMHLFAKHRLSNRAEMITPKRVRNFRRGQTNRRLVSEDDNVDEDEGDYSADDDDSALLHKEPGDSYFVEGRNCTNKYCVESMDCMYSINDLANRTDALVYISEFKTAESMFRRAGFVISSMR